MPENEKQEKKVEENKNTQKQENEKSGVFKEYSDLKSNVEQGRKDSKAERNTIENILKQADDKVKERKKELFLEKLNKEMEGKLNEPITFDKLTVEQRREFDNFQIPEDKLKKLYRKNGTSEEIKNLTEERNNQLDGLGNQIDEFYKKLDQEIKDRQERLNNTKDEDERKKLEEEIKKITQMKEELGASKEDKSPIRQTLAQAFNNHDEARMNAVNGLMLVYSENIVRNDKDFIDKVVPSKQREEFEKGASKNEATKNEGKENIAENAPKNQVMNNGKNVAGNVAQEQKGEKNPTGMDYLFALGYSGNNLNAKDSKKVLDAFVNEDPKKQLKIITDKDSQEAIFNAIKKANGRMTPVFALKFNKTRNALLNMANDSMLRKSLETIGIDTKNLDKEELGKAFDEEFKKYQDERSGIEEKINSMEDGEEKKKLQVELADLDKKYSSISGANEFRDMTSKELNKIKNRIADNLDYSKTKTIIGARTDSNMKTTNNNPIVENKSQSNRDLNDISYLRSGVKDKDAVLDKDINEITSGNNKQVGKEDRKQDRTQGR